MELQRRYFANGPRFIGFVFRSTYNPNALRQFAGWVHRRGFIQLRSRQAIRVLPSALPKGLVYRRADRYAPGEMPAVFRKTRPMCA